MNEEIMVRFGADTGPVDQAFRKIQSGAGEAHKSFLHASNGAREFHKLLHGISEQSPIMGTALRTAMSPVSGLFLGIGVAVKYVMSQLEELNKRFDELGTAAEHPLYNIVNLLHVAKMAAQRFNEEYFNWRNKPRKDEDIEFMEEKLSLLKLQVAEASKLDPSKAKALEKASVQAQLDIQARELRRTGVKMGGAQENADSAARAMEIALKEPTIAKAQATIKEDQRLMSDMQKEIDKAEAVISARKSALVPGLPTEGLEGDVTRMKGLRKAAENRIEENNRTIERETNERKKIADAVAETKGIYDQYKNQFEALSKALNSTSQHLSILTGVSNPEHPAELSGPIKNLKTAQNNSDFSMAMWNYHIEKGTQDWNKAHGMSWHDVTMPVNANRSGDDVGNDIAALNTLFRGITTPDGMKVTFLIKDD